MRFVHMAGLASLCLTFGATAALSDSGKGHGKIKQTNSARIAGCPPGLAKKNPPCVPPGQAKKRYLAGERITGDFILIEDPFRYGLNSGTYYRLDDDIYRVNRETREVLNFIGAAAALLN